MSGEENGGYKKNINIVSDSPLTAFFAFDTRFFNIFSNYYNVHEES
jgi:hypothetical protein